MTNKRLQRIQSFIPNLFLFTQALLNLGTRDPSLRLAAYNLLCALTTVFHLKIEERLFEGTGTVTLQLRKEGMPF